LGEAENEREKSKCRGWETRRQKPLYEWMKSLILKRMRRLKAFSREMLHTKTSNATFNWSSGVLGLFMNVRGVGGKGLQEHTKLLQMIRMKF
jgi:hypothetical protein